ncbi:transposase [Streptosporangium sp. NPDC049376]|uniref:transposase n=1 Tax=Streptosporangium sp. NPDC049376 TaxID=3366192 RepID=UPI0037905E02
MAVSARLEHLSATRLQAGLDDAFAHVAGRFGRREVRLRARSCLQGLLSGLQRTTGWSLAEHAGEATPDGMQRLFSTAKWDVDAVRDDIRTYVIDHLGDADGVLVGDDTGFEKKGTCSGGRPPPEPPPERSDRLHLRHGSHTAGARRLGRENRLNGRPQKSSTREHCVSSPNTQDLGVVLRTLQGDEGPEGKVPGQVCPRGGTVSAAVRRQCSGAGQSVDHYWVRPRAVGLCP